LIFNVENCKNAASRKRTENAWLAWLLPIAAGKCYLEAKEQLQGTG
jgi:hypothetical protein